MNMDEVTRLVVVDDHTLLREGLVCLLALAPDIEVVGEAANGEEALYICAMVQPHIVLMNIMMPELDGIATTRKIRQQFPDIQVIILTSRTDEEFVQQALAAGALSYIIKTTSSDALVSAIRAAKQRVSTLAPEARLALIHSKATLPEVGDDLTEREQEVLILLAEGMSNQEIARQLHISYSTVQFHVGHILSKLGATNRVQAATVAIRNHIVS